MVVTNEAKNRIRDLILNDLGTGEHGTDGTSPTVGDTDLGASDALTSSDLNITIGNKMLNTSHVLLSTIGNGTTYKEFGVFFNNGDILNRVVYPDFTKTSSLELHTTTTIRIK